MITGTLPTKYQPSISGFLSDFSNPHFTPSMATSTVIIPYHPIFKSAHLQISSEGKRNALLPCCRQAFRIWAVTSTPQKTIECIISEDISVQDDSNKGELESCSDHLSVLKGLGLKNREIKFLIKKHPFLLDQTPDSLLQRIQALQALGIRGSELIRLLKKRPSVFTVELESTFEFINGNFEGFDVERFQRVLFRVDSELVLDFPDKIRLLLQHGVQKSDIGKVLNKMSLQVFCKRSLEELNEVLLYLKGFQEDKEYCWIVVRHPTLLLLNVERDLVPKVRILQDFLKDEDFVRRLIWRFPGILVYSVEHLEKRFEYLSSSMFSEEDLVRVIKFYPQILTISIERRLKPRIEYLKKCGLKEKEIAKLLRKYPSFLGLSLGENLSRKSVMLQKIGFEPYSYQLAQAMSTVTRISYENLENTIDLFLSYGLTYEDIYNMGSKQPHILRYSYECLKPKIDYLVNSMHYSSKILVSFPTFLGYSLEDRIRPRHQIMQQLISKGLAKENYSVIRLLAISDKEFMRMAIKKGYDGSLNY